LIPHATATSALGQINGRQDFIEVSMDLTRLVEALGPDILFDVPKAFRGEPNTLLVRDLISAAASVLPGFVAELAGADPLRRLAFRVEARHERNFIEGLRTIVQEVLLEPPGLRRARTGEQPLEKALL
jgi:hypothetical protein